MAKEMLEAIIKAENEAKAKKSSAVADAKARVDLAETEGKALFERTAASAVQSMNKKLELIKEQTESLTEKSRAEAEAEAAAETEAAMVHMHDAVAVIIGELMNNVGK